MTTGPRRTLLLLATGCALMLGACSSSTAPSAASAPNRGAVAPAAPSAVAPAAPSAAAAGTADACALLTKAEVEVAFGESMLAPVASVDHGDASCSWMHEAAGLDLTVAISSRPSTAAAIKAMAAAYGGASHDVAGVGDAALEVAGVLQFVKGTTLVTIGTGDGPGIITDTTLQALTKLAAGRV